MGRLDDARARRRCTVAFLVLGPLAALFDDRLTVANGAPVVAILLGLVVAFLLCVGPRSGFAVGVVLVAEALLDGAAPGAALVVAALRTVACLGAVRLLEARFTHHGPVRSPLVMVDFSLVAAALLPLLHAGVPSLVAWTGLGTEVAGPFAQRAVAHGLGVLAVTAGTRMLLMGERAQLEPRARRGVAAATSVTTLTLAVPLATGASDLVASGQLLLVPLLVVALLAGTVAYSIAILLTALAVLVPAATGFLAALDLPLGVGSQAVWWAGVVAGYLLAVDGDRRRAVQRQFRALFTGGATPTATVTTHDGRVVEANTAMARLLGAGPARLAGRPIDELVGGEPIVVGMLGDLVGGGTGSGEVEFALQVGPDDERWVRCTGVRIPLGGPQADVVQVQLLDLTAERARREGLERSNRALERLGRRVAHDLTQPLAAIAGFARTLEEHHDALDPDVRRSMLTRLDTVAARAVEQLRATLDHALQRSRMSSSVDLHEVMQAVSDMVGIELVAVDGTITTSLEVSAVWADPAVVRQVMANLIGNSIKYADPDRPARVRVAAQVRSGGVEVTVTDNGVGIPEERLDEVFEPGRRLVPDHAEGRGLGLSDSRDLVEAAGGSLWVEPRSRGARFVLWFPAPAGVAAGDRGDAGAVVDSSAA